MTQSKSVPMPPKGGDVVIPPHERKSLQSLSRSDCRWPIGDPQHKDFHFCGRQQVSGRPYCEFHMRRGFQPTRPREYRPPVAA